ncbi:hypothetical protein AB4455_19485 [Vibrio sp. 10N.261.46.E12]|nr:MULTISPECIES: hypothetical protein [unclassified Vibrio]OMO33834.1 hypothetical protein BH584_00580 [Vibrio sp. 10N.261.45.E1]PMJ19332.1 hypothetical protein BCU27_21645 [Vibrio sp. 10N.286.45.B6]PML97977.1 hypothetical protein BCT66_20635 [Vibrio sp. 10N.261.49.E11]PMM83131.1 hypothetical protein BCT46_02330 [Vibrio sp. 10N.261.46.E8]PMN59087.1 hypothetical protein BCT32_22350 [Vibrio sp. 10N.261.45.E11]
MTKTMKTILSIAMSLPLVGCFNSSSDELLLNKISNLEAQIRDIKVNGVGQKLEKKEELAKSIVSNPRFGNVAAYVIAKERRSTNDVAFINQLLSVHQEMAREEDRVSMYKVLFANGVQSVKNKVLPNQPNMVGYLVRDDWQLVVPKTSNFAYDFPYNAYELFQYEKLTYTDSVCNDGFTPFALHALLTKKGYEGELPEVTIQNEKNSWRVLIGNKTLQEFSDFKVLLQVRCKEKTN